MSEFTKGLIVGISSTGLILIFAALAYRYKLTGRLS